MMVPLTHRWQLKIATTWEGVQAAAQLEKAGYHVNMTLLFSLAQVRPRSTCALCDARC